MGWHGIPNGGALAHEAALNRFQVRKLDSEWVPAMPEWTRFGSIRASLSWGVEREIPDWNGAGVPAADTRGPIERRFDRSRARTAIPIRREKR